MAEERSTNHSRSGRGSRRRYFRRRSSGGKSGDDAQGKEQPAARRAEPDTSGAPARNTRISRRRKRTRSRSLEAATRPAPPTADSITNLSDYTPPQEVFIYTHVTRPGSRDSYEFRAEHFSKVGRRLEDYEIDLSTLYPGEPEEEAAT